MPFRMRGGARHLFDPDLAARAIAACGNPQSRSVTLLQAHRCFTAKSIFTRRRQFRSLEGADVLPSPLGEGLGMRAFGRINSSPHPNLLPKGEGSYNNSLNGK